MCSNDMLAYKFCSKMEILLRRTEEQKFLLEIAERQWKEDTQGIAKTKANIGDWRDDYID